MLQVLDRWQIVLAAIALGTTFQFFRLFYNLFFHPLRSVPGPRLAAASNIWVTFKTFTLQKCEALDACIRKYGPVVRIAPNKILISTQEDVKTVYGVGSKHLKSDFYPPWGLDGASNIFSTTDPKDHSVRRSITAKTFSKNSVVQFMPELIGHAQAMVHSLAAKCHENKDDTTTIEFLKLVRHMALDILGTATLGEDFALIRTGREHPFVHDLDSAAMVIPIRASMPSWLWPLAKSLPSPKWQRHLGGEKRLSEYASGTVDRAFTAEEQGKTSERPTLVSSYAAYQSPDGTRLSNDRIIGEIAAVYFAGTDTTSNTLTFAMYEIARRPDVQEKLRAELHEKMNISEKSHDSPSEVDFPAFEELEENCPYLNAVMSESFRLYAAIPSHLERVVPPTGTTLSNGQFMPAGTIIGVQTWSLHRDPAVFPHPDKFDPDRWLDATPEMQKALSPWGFGSRICMGMHLAYIEFRLVMTAMVANFEVTLPEGFKESDMTMKNLWFVFPVKGTLDLVLRKLAA